MKNIKGSITLFFILFFLLFVPSEYSPYHKEVMAAPIIDNSSSNNHGSFNTSPWIHAIGNYPDRLLIVGVDEENDYWPVSSVTCKDNANIVHTLTFLLSQNSNQAGRDTTKIYYMVNPPIGACTIDVNGPDPMLLMAGAISLYNVDVNNPFGPTAGYNPAINENPINLTVSGTDTSQFVIGVASAFFTGLSENAGTTNQWIGYSFLGRNFFGSYGSSKPGEAGSTTLSWNTSWPMWSDHTSLFGIAVNERKYTITGNVFNDLNKNLIMDGGEPLIAGAVVNSTRGTVVSPFMGNTYQVQNLAAGTYTISYTSALPAGFYLLHPKPPSFNVIVGSGCSVDTTTGASCVSNNIINLNFAVTNSMPWIQTYGLDIREDSGFSNPIPSTANAACGGGAYASGTTGFFTSPGVVFSGDASSDFGQGFPSRENWVVGGMSYPEVFQSTTPLKTSTQSLLAAAAKAGITITPLEDLNTCRNPSTGCNLNPLGRGFYHTSGNIKIDQNANFNNGNYVIVSDGTIRITNGKKINVATNATVIFSARDVIIDSSIGASTNTCPVPAGQIQGIFSADNNIIVEGNDGNCSVADKALNMEGTFIANAMQLNGSFQNKRDLCGDNTTYPSITIKARPDFILHTPGFLTEQNTISHEEAP